MNLLEIRNVSKTFSNHVALDDVSFVVPRGRIFGLLGPNGAGKTTLIRILNQILMPDSGTVSFDGHALQPADVRKMGYLPEERGLYKKMRVGEQALYLARLKGLTKEIALQRLHFWLSKFEMESWWNKRVEELSKGMQQKVQFITTLLHEPDCLILDEPFSGFDPVNANLLKNEILELKKKGATVILSTHNMTSVEEICDNIVLLNHSRKILEGSLADVKQQYKKNHFKLSVAGLQPDFQTQWPQGFEILNQSRQGEVTTLVIHIHNELSSNELLQKMLPFGTICTFEEILPSMNEIFIDTVK